MYGIQKAVFTALDDDVTLSSMVTGMYDHVPQSTAFPYLEIGLSSFEDTGTKTEDVIDVSYEVHTWCRNTGSFEVKQIQDQIRVVLHNAALPVDAGQVILIREDFRQSFTDPDGISLHGVQRFNILYQYP